MASRPPTVDDYIAGCAPEAQKSLHVLRALVHDIVPDVTEKIGYGTPTFDFNGRYLIYFAAWKKHTP